MNFTILAKELKKGLGFTEKITGKNLTLPILNNLLIEALPNFLKISSTDLEIGMQWWGACKTEKEGSVVVPAKFISQLAGTLGEDKIEIKGKGNNLILEGKNIKTQIKGFSTEEFPIIPTFLKEIYIEMDGKKLKEGLSSVVDITSLSQIKPEISGVYFSFNKTNIKLVATDSFRLAEKTIQGEYKNLFNKDISFILPQKTVKELINILPEEDGKNIRIYFSESQVMFETFLPNSTHPEINIVSRQIDGQYPTYEEIIPKTSKTKIVVNKDEFNRQIKTAGLFGGKTNEVIIKIEEKGIEIKSQDSEIGESELNMPAITEGDFSKISFNYKFILDGLTNIKSSEISFEFQGNDGPAVIRPVGDASYLYVIMPIRI
ncbi:MAG: DNA polymerase III subunit beta [Candidatus Pacebacteria bacterium]|nr:DNA polymerase III subunit beta [Candidatus Paceibacterota bacterium]MDD4074336.1 DNA polymerase III subunit beta [Candidatus Paceibacterota bacterium]